MSELIMIPRWKQLTQFIQALRTDPSNGGRALFARLTDLCLEEVDDL